MKGIEFVVDDEGNRKAVLLDLEQWGDAWEDIYDLLVSRQRRDEPVVSWHELKAELHQAGQSE